MDKLDRLEQRLEQTIARFESLADRLEKRLAEVDQVQPEWVSKHVMSFLFDINPKTLAAWRNCQEWPDGSISWVEGVHYQRQPTLKEQGTGRNYAECLYNRDLLLHWYNLRSNPRQQLAAVDSWIKKNRIKK